MKKIAFLFCLFAFAACRKKTTEKAVDPALAPPVLTENGSKKDTLAEKTDPTALVLEFRKTPCFGSCPAFSVQIFGDGRAEYDGFRFAKRTGKFAAKLPEKWLEEVEKEFGAQGIFGLADAYPTDGRRIMDVPTTTVFFHGKRIEDNYDAPLALRKFEAFLDQKIEEIEWRADR